MEPAVLLPRDENATSLDDTDLTLDRVESRQLQNIVAYFIGRVLISGLTRTLADSASERDIAKFCADLGFVTTCSYNHPCCRCLSRNVPLQGCAELGGGESVNSIM